MRKENRPVPSIQRNAEITPKDTLRLRAFMKHELAFYNAINSEFSRLFRRNPDALANLVPEVIEQAAILIANGITVQDKDAKYTNSINVVKTSDKDFYGLINLIKTKNITLHPEIKFLMAQEIIRFYVNSVKIGNMKSTTMSQEFLENMDENRKRHVQLHRKHINVQYDEATHQTIIKTPYTNDPIIVNGIDMKKDKSWKILVIHQRPGKLVRPDTPWSIDFRNTDEPYLLKYIEMANPYNSSAHHQAIKSSRSAVF